MSTPTQEKVWMKFYSEEARNTKLPKCTAYRYVKENNKDRLDETALTYYGAKITYRQLIRRIDETAQAFVNMGVKKGDVVSFLSVQFPETIAAVYALNKIGAVANAIDPRMDIGSIKRMILASGSRILVTVDIDFPKVKAIMADINQDYIITQSAAASLPFIKKAVMTLKTKTDIPYGEKIIKWKEFLSRGKDAVVEEAPYVGDATVAITYTGGTTGYPKGVMLTNDSMNAVCINFKYSGIVYEQSDKFLGIIPVFSAYGMVCGMHMPLALGLNLVPVPKFNPLEFGKLVMTYRPNHLISTPAFIELLINSKEVQGKDLSFLATLGSGGDTMNEGLERKLGQFIKDHNMKYPLAQGYGMSELSAAASFCVGDIYKPRSVGIPSVTTTVGIFDRDTGEELGYNRRGEICVTGPSMMKAYFNAPEETEFVMRKHADGQVWIHSGDVGYLDEEGFLFVIGRMKRMITRFDGHKVFPINLEGMITELPDVHNCAVVGTDDMEHSQGQYPMALVEVEKGVDAAAVCKRIFDHCNENAEERGRPVAVVAVEKLPLTPMGKVDNKKLEAEYKDFDYLAWAAKK